MKSKFPVRMDGLFGSELIIPNYCLVKIKFEDREGKELKVALPAYVVKEIPGSGDLLIGMDQMGPGKIVGLNIPRNKDQKVSVSVGKANTKRGVSFNLTPVDSEGVYVNEHNSTSTQ